MAEWQTQEPDTNGGTRGGAGVGGKSGRSTGFFPHSIWLWILLLILGGVLFAYDHPDFKDFREKANSRTAPLLAEWSQKAKHLYECGIPGCKSAKAPVAAVGVAAAKPGEVPVPGQTGNPVHADASVPQPATAVASATPSVTPSVTPATEGQTPAGTANYPAYPDYPAYPPYPPNHGFGNGGSADTASTSAGSSPPSNAASPQAQQAVQPPTPPKPEAAPGKPAYPNYPAYPSYTPMAAAAPSSAPNTPQAQQAPAIAPQAQPAPAQPGLPPAMPVVRPDQRPTKGDDPRLAAERQPGQMAADKLQLARQAAAAGRFPQAVHEYLQYLTKHPDDADAYGELGNVYLTAGRFQEAAQNYYEVATRLVDLGQLAALPRLMPIIERYEPRLAVLIHQKIANRSRGQPH
jgi:hypothetical protein